MFKPGTLCIAKIHFEKVHFWKIHLENGSLEALGQAFQKIYQVLWFFTNLILHQSCQDYCHHCSHYHHHHHHHHHHHRHHQRHHHHHESIGKRREMQREIGREEWLEWDGEIRLEWRRWQEIETEAWHNLIIVVIAVIIVIVVVIMMMIATVMTIIAVIILSIEQASEWVRRLPTRPSVCDDDIMMLLCWY